MAPDYHLDGFPVTVLQQAVQKFSQGGQLSRMQYSMLFSGKFSHVFSTIQNGVHDLIQTSLSTTTVVLLAVN